MCDLFLIVCRFSGIDYLCVLTDFKDLLYEEEVVFEYVISKNENGAIIEYETLIDKLSLNVVAQDSYIYKIDYTYVSKFVEAFPIQGQFIVTYEENYKNYEIEFIYPTN